MRTDFRGSGIDAVTTRDSGRHLGGRPRFLLSDVRDLTTRRSDQRSPFCTFLHESPGERQGLAGLSSGRAVAQNLGG